MAKDVRWCIVFLVAFLLCMQEIHARSMPKQRKDDNDSDEDSDSSSSEEQKGDCFYKGKWYSEGEDLPTDSLCLVCTCRKGFTEPSRFTCAVKDCPWGYYQVKYPNCTPVYSSTECCPVDWKCDSTDDEPEIKHGLSSIPSYCFRPVPLPFVPCKDRSQRYFYDMFSGDCKPFHYGACSLGVQNSFLTKEDCLETCKGVKVKREHKFELVMPTPRCKCDKRFFRHYEVKGCKPVYGRTDCEHCPSYYDCPETHEDSKVCIHDGVTYEPGQAIDLGPCHKCSCQWRGGEVGTVAEIVCPVNIECPEGFHKPLSKGCYHVYEQGKCCSVETRCVADETAESGTCEYDGKQYKYGQRIYPKEDPCAKCICSEKWDGPKGQTCEKMQCSEVEVHKADLLEGCIPIYHEATCCPIEYHCPNTTDGKKTVQGKEHDKCYFDGEAYPLRSVLPINHPTGCVTCTCRTPPDFTCIHRRCPSPPEEKEGVTCTPTFTPGSCCPTYKCQNDADVPEFCLEEPSPAFSHCPDESVRYYYDRYTGTCRSFKYGSCTVSKKNIFLTETECLNVCKKGNADQDNVVSNPVHDHPVQKCKCNPIHFQHYEAKGCKAVYGDSKCPKCPTHFECPTEIQKDKKVCTHKGKEYQIGEKVESGPCQRCICRESFDSQSAEISCAIVECPRERSGQRLGRGCRRIYEQGKCCAVSTVCENDNSTSTTDSEVTCDYDGKIYPFGDKIYLKDNPCRYCYCNKDWSGPDGPTCVEIDCVIEKKKKNLERGCIPVYLENSCCPITWHCPASASGEETKDLVQQEVKDMVQQGDKCYFGGKSYELGSILQVSESGSCITCTCSTPPDFTCIYRYCPPPPDSSTLEPGSTCRPVFRHDTCCPEYQCTSHTKKAIDRPLTRLLLGKWHTCNCDSRYFQHYKVKNCKPVFDDPSCNCPTRFECPSLQHLSNNCNYKGVIYDFMDHINSSNPCKKCECMASDDGLEIGCTQIECPEDLGVRPEGECRYVYKADKCCAVNKVCGQEIDKAEFTCEYEGKKYVPGEKIHHKHDPCKVCYCTRDWDGMDGTRSQCYSSDCMLEKKMKVLKRGCVPVYHEKTCCPIEYYCPEDYQKYIVPVEKKDYICSLPVDPGSCRALFDKYYFDVQTGKCTKFYYGGCDGNENRFDSLEECEKACENHFRRPADSEKQCQFGIHFYPVGHVLEPPNKCVTCTCTTPPDFTCIHRSCPPPPSDDCQLSSRQQSCCPSYICPLPKSTCSLPPDSGICLAAFRRYFYNPREGKCQQFIYGGCLGNENNFWSPEDCEAACGHHRDSTGAEFLLSQEPALDRCKEIKCEAGEECKLQKVCTGRHCLLRPRCTKISSECEVPKCTEGCVLSIGDDQCPTCECSLLRKVSSKNSSEPEFHLVGLSEVKDSCSGVKCSDGKECKLQKVCTGRHCLLRPRCVSATGCDTPVCTEPGCVLVVSDEPNSCPTCECTLLKKPSGNKLHEFLVSTGIKHTHHSGKKSSESSAPEFILSASSVHESGCKGLRCGDDEECTMQKVCTGRHCLLRPKCTKHNLDCPTPICAEGCALTLSDDGSGCLTCECSLLKKDSSSEFHELVSDDDVKNSCLGIKCSDGKECKLQKVCTGRHCLLRPRCVSATGCDVPECTELGCILVVHDESKSCPTCECTLLKKPSRSSSPAPVLSASSAYRASCKGVSCADDEECTLQKVCTDRHCLIRPRCAKHNLSCPTPVCSEGCAPSLGDDGCPSCECSLLKKVTGDSESVRYQAVSASDLLHSCSEMHCPEGKECRLQKVCTDRHCLLRPRCISSGSQCPEPDCTEGCVPVVTGDDGCPTCECKLLRKPSSQSSKN